MLTPAELGHRLRAARDSCGLTQDDVAAELGVSRSTVTQIELGNRGVSGIELGKLAFLFGRDMRELLAPEYQDVDPLGPLFRSEAEVSGNDAVVRKLRECVALGRELTNLERLVGIDRDVSIAATYQLAAPRNRWEAIEQGARIADEERRRLGLGTGPVPDLGELLETQGVRTAVVELPEDVSGLTISDPRIGLFVVANVDQHFWRRRFSFTHEYDHVLLDRDRFGMVSRGSKRDELIEVRANSFAACFLMPSNGVHQFIATLGKGRPTRMQLDIFDDEQPVAAETRTDPRSQAIQIYDLVQLAHHFAVSRATALYRLKNLRILKTSEFDSLRVADERHGDRVAKALELPQPDHEASRTAFRHRFLGLALEALRREEITRSKLEELASMMKVSKADVASLLADTGLESGNVSSEAGVSLPDDE
jgi:Zn-dependent peptidase ImmA (M78 family)/transcriptional regulator with XRE-family HTH domain